MSHPQEAVSQFHRDSRWQSREDLKSLSHEFRNMAARGLVKTFDFDKKQFCHRVRRAKDGIFKEGLSYCFNLCGPQFSLDANNDIEHLPA